MFCAVATPWAAAFLDASDVRSPSLQAILLDAAARGEEGDLLFPALVVAGVFDAMRIHYTRAYRASQNSDGVLHEDYLPAIISIPALSLFPDAPALTEEPKLRDDKHGPIALQRLGFSVETLLLIRLAEGYFLATVDAVRDRRKDPSTPPTPEQLADGLRAIATFG